MRLGITQQPAEEAQVLEHVGDGFTRADAGKVSHVAEQFHARIPHAVAAGAGETQPTRARQPSQFLDDPGGVTIRRGLAGNDEHGSTGPVHRYKILP